MPSSNNKTSDAKSAKSHAILDAASRRRKAVKIAAIVSGHRQLADADLLDIGTGSGHIADEFTRQVKRVVSVDLNDERDVREGYEFIKVDGAALPFDDDSFDIVVSNHVVEHVPDQRTHLAELMRVVRPGGVVYLATPNKLWLRDPHYRLPFISWLPRQASQAYLRTIKPGKVWDIYPMSHFGIRKQLGHHQLHNALPDLVKKQGAKKLDVWQGAVGILRFAPTPLLKVTQYFSPTLIYIVKKRS